MVVQLPELDLASALTLLGDAVSGHVVDALHGTGLRHGHGYLVQRLVVGPATATEIADALGITQQAVSKAIRELTDLGHVAPVPDPADRRRRPVGLTAKGRRAVRTARAARSEVDERIRAALGTERFEQTRQSLIVALEAVGLTDAVARRSVPPPASGLG